MSARHDRRRGLALVAVLWLLMLLGILAYAFGTESLTEARAGRVTADRTVALRA